MGAAAIISSLVLILLIVVMAYLAHRSLPRGTVFVKRGKKERQAMSRIVEKHSRWSGGSGGGGGA